jgi:hypothetical protein
MELAYSLRELLTRKSGGRSGGVLFVDADPLCCMTKFLLGNDRKERILCSLSDARPSPALATWDVAVESVTPYEWTPRCTISEGLSEGSKGPDHDDLYTALEPLLFGDDQRWEIVTLSVRNGRCAVLADSVTDALLFSIWVRWKTGYSSFPDPAR